MICHVCEKDHSDEELEEMLREEHDARMEAATALDVEKALHADTKCGQPTQDKGEKTDD
jgi:hypothetical protein